jgi:hypothetical protein
MRVYIQIHRFDCLIILEQDYFRQAVPGRNRDGHFYGNYVGAFLLAGMVYVLLVGDVNPYLIR